MSIDTNKTPNMEDVDAKTVEKAITEGYVEFYNIEDDTLVAAIPGYYFQFPHNVDRYDTPETLFGWNTVENVAKMVAQGINDMKGETPEDSQWFLFYKKAMELGANIRKLDKLDVDVVKQAMDAGIIQLTNDEQNYLVASCGGYTFDFYRNSDDPFRTPNDAMAYEGTDGLAKMVCDALNSKPIRGRNLDDSQMFIHFKETIDMGLNPEVEIGTDQPIQDSDEECR